MIGFVIAIISGISMSLQGIFNTKLGEKIGVWETNVFVQASALLITLIVLFFFGDGDFKNIKTVNKVYLISGVLSVIIIFTVMKSISSLGTTVGIGTILIAQITTAALIDAFGLFGNEKISFGPSEVLGIIIMIAGIVLFEWKF